MRRQVKMASMGERNRDTDDTIHIRNRNVQEQLTKRSICEYKKQSKLIEWRNVWTLITIQNVVGVTHCNSLLG